MPPFPSQIVHDNLLRNLQTRLTEIDAAIANQKGGLRTMQEMINDMANDPRNPPFVHLSPNLLDLHPKWNQARFMVRHYLKLLELLEQEKSLVNEEIKTTKSLLTLSRARQRRRKLRKYIKKSSKRKARKRSKRSRNHI